jgi:hypothetical protein
MDGVKIMTTEYAKQCAREIIAGHDIQSDETLADYAADFYDTLACLPICGNLRAWIAAALNDILSEGK